MNIIHRLQNITKHNGKPAEVVYARAGLFVRKQGVKEYKKAKQNFNTYYQFDPLAIVYCESSEQVRDTLLIATEENRTVRVRSGGHDHEGECSANDAIIIDLSKIKAVIHNNHSGIAEIGPGATFEDLVRILYGYGVVIPHGTCPSVAVAGFISGGGWGPWTRLKGMCCESLEAVSIVLGDGEIAYLDNSTARGRELLWAIRGGGGMSYGIITMFYIKTFPLPDNLLKFELKFGRGFSSMGVMKAWEQIIAAENTPELTGTNLRIKAKNPNDPDAEEECIVYGSFADTAEQLKAKIGLWFGGLELNTNRVEEILSYVILIDNGRQVTDQQFFRELYVDWELTAAAKLAGGTPAPHKITSRVVVKNGLGESGRKHLYASLNSTMLPTDKELDEAGFNCYATHNAISGVFYAKYPSGNKLSSFPYKERPFIIQYQAWWGKKKADSVSFEKYLNSVLDWQQECRDRLFPETSGSFISFKDASIMTKNYFAEHYDQLKAIKHKWSNDPDNFLSSRKTII